MARDPVKTLDARGRHTLITMTTAVKARTRAARTSGLSSVTLTLTRTEAALLAQVLTERSELEEQTAQNTRRYATKDTPRP